MKGKRDHVHLSADAGRPQASAGGVAGRMVRYGYEFSRSENGVWLWDAMPPSYIRE